MRLKIFIKNTIFNYVFEAINANKKKSLMFEMLVVGCFYKVLLLFYTLW